MTSACRSAGMVSDRRMSPPPVLRLAERSSVPREPQSDAHRSSACHRCQRGAVILALRGQPSGALILGCQADWRPPTIGTGSSVGIKATRAAFARDVDAAWLFGLWARRGALRSFQPNPRRPGRSSVPPGSSGSPVPCSSMGLTSPCRCQPSDQRSLLSRINTAHSSGVVARYRSCVIHVKIAWQADARLSTGDGYYR